MVIVFRVGNKFMGTPAFFAETLVRSSRSSFIQIVKQRLNAKESPNLIAS